MSDHEYTLTVRPNAHLRVAYTTDNDGLERAVVAVEYGRDGLEASADEAGTDGFEWRGYGVTFARDGRTLLGGDEAAFGRTVEALFDRDITEDDRVRRGLDTAKRYGRRLRDRAGKLRERRSEDLSVPDGSVEPPETIDISGPGEAEIDASRTETAAAFECYEDGGGNWRWRLAHDDGDTLAVCPSGYDSREEAEEVISKLKANVLGAEIES